MKIEREKDLLKQLKMDLGVFFWF